MFRLFFYRIAIVLYELRVWYEKEKLRTPFFVYYTINWSFEPEYVDRIRIELSCGPVLSFHFTFFAPSIECERVDSF